MSKISEWILVEDGAGACRYLLGQNPMIIANRVAFIEKTPRVRIRSYDLAVEYQWNDRGDRVGERRQWEDFLNWADGYKGDGPGDEESRKWCDDMLKLLGYEL